MSDTVVGIHTIGQTPRPDLMEGLTGLLGLSRFEMRGALDDLTRDQVPACDPDGYPLETRLRDGTPIVADAAFLEPHLQDAIADLDSRVSAHLVLCAGTFPSLTARKPLIQPVEVAVAELSARGLESLEVMVPFGAQAVPSARKWEAAGFSCRIHVFGESGGRPLTRWLADRLGKTSADALVFDYVGSPAEVLESVGPEIEIPVFALGRLAIDALERTLQTL